MISKRRSRRLVAKDEGRDSAPHLVWVRSQGCCVRGCKSKHVQAHHVRSAATSGTGLKPPDRATVPLCHDHHRELHNEGAETFQAEHRLSLVALADLVATRSPHL